jgi:hypothetical protein
MTRRPLRVLALAAALAILALAVPTQSHALIVGLGDQKASTFSDPLFQQLRVKRTRLIVPWDAINNPSQVQGVDEWFAAARAARQEIVVAFNLSAGDACPLSPCRAPSVSQYRSAVRAFHRRYGRFVKIYQPWNESNSRTQPTAGNRGARLVAKYYLALRRIAGRRRIVTGADIQDIGDFIGYTRTFLRAAGRRNVPKVMGFHNYTDTNRFKYRATTRFVAAMPRGTKVWLTETGAVYRFVQQNGTVSLPPSESRARRSMQHMFKIARRFRRAIDRIYVYQWSAFETDRFDAGVVNPDGTPRASYHVLRQNRRFIR